MEDEIRLGDVIRTRKPHPCGSDTWTVTRTGADIKLKCRKCGRVVMLDRVVFLKRRKATLERGPEPNVIPVPDEGTAPDLINRQEEPQ